MVGIYSRGADGSCQLLTLILRAQELLDARVTTKELARSSLFFQRLLEGHVYDVNCCRFFPSGLVVLSGGMDAQLKIWSVEDASCAVTFQGHKGGRECSAFPRLRLLPVLIISHLRALTTSLLHSVPCKSPEELSKTPRL